VRRTPHVHEVCESYELEAWPAACTRAGGPVV